MLKPLVVTVLAVLLSGSPAWAQGVSATTTPAPELAPAPLSPSASAFGKQGSMSVAAERLFGISHTSPSSGSSVTTFSFLGGSGLEAGVAPYSIPRVGFDYFPADGLSFGLGAEVATVDESSGSMTIVGMNPRVGYAAPVSEGLSFWPRVGLSYVNASISSQSSYVLAATLEVQVVVTPLRHFGFMIAPTLDVGLAATRSKLTQIGLHAGLIGWF